MVDVIGKLPLESAFLLFLPQSVFFFPELVDTLNGLSQLESREIACHTDQHTDAYDDPHECPVGLQEVAQRR